MCIEQCLNMSVKPIILEIGSFTSLEIIVILQSNVPKTIKNYQKCCSDCETYVKEFQAK